MSSNWLSKLPPGIKKIFRPQDASSDALWAKCAACGEMIFQKDLDANLQVCPSCQHHMKIGASARLKALFDGGLYETIAPPEAAADPLKFRDEKKYADRLKENRKKTGRIDAVEIGAGAIEGVQAIAAVQDFEFMGGSMGMGVGEALLKAAEEAVSRRRPLVLFTASGGARMQEGILSLMQMPRTTIAVQMLREARLPYVVVLTHPTTGGVTASYAMLGDVHLAEPGALIGFAGPRVVEQTIRETLPEGFQRAEFLRDKGMVDMVVARKDLRPTLAKLLRVLMKSGAAQSRVPSRTGALAPPGAYPALLDKAAE
ncbi:MAG: acetyl-CoA carboxylase, carboxyltransferase subunit beta [Parvularculaceae bacterium]|nr:acetyl-CoA carboxylase, carboxyltransferase subunit beta [Parvularculaceae bacterium]